MYAFEYCLLILLDPVRQLVWWVKRFRVTGTAKACAPHEGAGSPAVPSLLLAPACSCLLLLTPACWRLVYFAARCWAGGSRHAAPLRASTLPTMLTLCLITPCSCTRPGYGCGIAEIDPTVATELLELMEKAAANPKPPQPAPSAAPGGASPPRAAGGAAAAGGGMGGGAPAGMVGAGLLGMTDPSSFFMVRIFFLHGAGALLSLQSFDSFHSFLLRSFG